MIWPFKEPVVIFDTETTGVITTQDRIVELGAMKIMPHTDDDSQCFCERVCVDIAIPPTAIAVHGISNADLVDCPEISTVLEDFFNFGGDSVYTAYNLPFDDEMINAELERHNIIPSAIPLWRFDVRCFAHRLINPNSVENYQLSTVAAYFGCDIEGAHNALFDVKLTYQVLKRLFERWGADYGDTDFSVWMQEPFLIKRFPFGKHKGMLISNIPFDYLIWARRKMVGDLLYTVEHYLNIRYGIE